MTFLGHSMKYLMVLHGIAWYCMMPYVKCHGTSRSTACSTMKLHGVLHEVPWRCMGSYVKNVVVLHEAPCSSMELHETPRYFVEHAIELHGTA